MLAVKLRCSGQSYLRCPIWPPVQVRKFSSKRYVRALTVLTGLVFIITEGTVKSSQLTQLVALKLVLAFGNRGGLINCVNSKILGFQRSGNRTHCFNDVVNKLLGFVHLFFGVGHDQAVKIFFLVATVGGIRSALSFLDGTFASNGDFSTGLGFHLFQGVSTGSYE